MHRSLLVRLLASTINREVPQALGPIWIEARAVMPGGSLHQMVLLFFSENCMLYWNKALPIEAQEQMSAVVMQRAVFFACEEVFLYVASSSDRKSYQKVDVGQSVWELLGLRMDQSDIPFQLIDCAACRLA